MNELQPIQKNELIKYDPELLKIAQETIFSGSTESELKLFLHKCDSCGVNPLSQMIYPFKKDGRVSFIASIDFLRSRAESSGLYDGQDEVVYEYRDNNSIPFSATAKVYRKDISRPFTCKVLFNEFKLDKYIWRTKPHIMIAKCAEAQALRKSFPEKLEKLYIPEEMGVEIKKTDKPNVEFEVIEDEAHDKVIPIETTKQLKVKVKDSEELKPLKDIQKKLELTPGKRHPIDDKTEWYVSKNGTKRIGPTDIVRASNKLITIKQSGLLFGEIKKQKVNEQLVCRYAKVKSMFYISRDKFKYRNFEIIFKKVQEDPMFFNELNIADIEKVDMVKEVINGSE